MGVFKCSWKIGDVFAYKIESEMAKEKEIYGQYFLTKSARIPSLQGRHRMHIGENDLEVYE